MLCFTNNCIKKIDKDECHDLDLNNDSILQYPKDKDNINTGKSLTVSLK